MLGWFWFIGLLYVGLFVVADCFRVFELGVM